MTIEEYVNKLCKHVGLLEDQFTVKIEEEEESVTLNLQLPEEESGLFIGYRGETLHSIQRLIRVTFYSDLEGKHLRFNINDYREQRQEQLREKALEAVQQVLDSGEPYTFSYLNSRDRFLVHSTIGEHQEADSLVSESVGEGRDRYLTIRPKSQDE